MKNQANMETLGRRHYQIVAGLDDRIAFLRRQLEGMGVKTR